MLPGKRPGKHVVNGSNLLRCRTGHAAHTDVVQVGELRSTLCLPVDLVKIHCDAASLRCFMTYLIKRHDGSTRQDAKLQIGTLFIHPCCSPSKWLLFEF